MPFNKKLIVGLILIACFIGTTKHFFNCLSLVKTFPKTIHFSPPGADFMFLKPCLERLGIGEAGFMTDKTSPGPAPDVQIMHEYQGARYALLPVRLDYSQARDHDYIILKCFEEKNRQRIIENLRAEIVVQGDHCISLIRKKK